jgi:hypothetical protein
VLIRIQLDPGPHLKRLGTDTDPQHLSEPPPPLFNFSSPFIFPLYSLFADPLVCRKYKKRFNSEILCAALWGVNLLIGTENGLMLLDRSGQGETSYLLPASRLLLHGRGMPTGDNCLSFVLFFFK